jgi:DedD protein
MERPVKERLIGASILVALIVLVVPELLSGPKPGAPPTARLPAVAPEPIRTVTVDLATSKAPALSDEPASAVPVPANPAPANAVPASAAPASAAPASAPPASAGASEPANPGPVETTAPTPTSTPHALWAVQLGSFASRANSDNLVHQLKAQGFSVYVLSGGAGPALRYRVRIGPLADRQSAERLAARLKSLGHVSSIVAPSA